MLGMRRRLYCGILLLPFAGVLAGAQVPPIVPLTPLPSKDPPSAPPGLGASPKTLPGGLAQGKELIPDDDLSVKRARLQAELEQLLTLLANRPAPATVMPVQPPAKPKPVLPLTEGRAVDSIRAGMNFFRDNDFNSALFAFQNIDVNSLASREDRAYVQYMKACCYRRLNRLNDAVNTFREVADAHDDDFLVECAIWQLAMVRQSQEIQGQIDQIRARLKL